MIDDQELVTLLRQGGGYGSTQRLRVASVLRKSHGHLTVKEIDALLQADADGVSYPLSTIYRALDALKKLRLVSEVNLGGRSAFEWVDHDHPHHHLACVDCGRERRLPPNLMAELTDAIQSRTGFEAFLDHMAISGICKTCASRRRRAKGPSIAEP